MSGARPGRGRDALIAVVLSGLAPGAGHLFVGRARRAALWLVAIAASFVAWAWHVPRSLLEAELWLLFALGLTLALIVDSGRIAWRIAERPRAPWNGWWALALAVVLFNVLAPGLFLKLVRWRAGLVTQPDSGLSPLVESGDRVVFRRVGSPPDRRELAVVADGDGRLAIRRVAALPGDVVSARGGVLVVEAEDGRPRRHAVSREHDLPETRLAADEILVVVDRDDLVADSDPRRLPLSGVRGVPRYVLLPGRLDEMGRLGMQVP